MKTSITILFLLLFVVSFSQGFDTTVNLSKNQFSIHLYNEMNKPKLDNNPLNQGFELVSCSRHTLKLSYRRSVSNDFGIYFRAGYGFGAFAYWDDFYDSVVFPNRFQNYTWTSIWDDFSNLEIGINYQKPISAKFLINTSIGFGYNYSNGYSRGVTHGFSNNNELKLNLNYNNARKPNLSLEFGVSRILKNKNLLSLGFTYQYSFSKPYSGTYAMYRDDLFQYNGEFYGPNSNFGLNLFYTFTGNKMMEKALKRASEKGTSYLTEKKKLKRERRRVHPKSIFIGTGAGLFFTKNKIKDKDSPFESGYYPWWNLNAFAEFGVKSNCFYEFGFAMEEYSEGTRIKNVEYSRSWGNMYIASKFSAGVGKRFFHKPTNLKLINIHAGLGVILTYNTNKTTKSSSGGGYYTENDTLRYSAIDDYKLLFAPTVYIMLEKDFQLTKNFFISLRYRYDQGIFPMFKQDVSYTYNGTKGTTENLVYGTSQTYGFAFKFKFLEKKYREN